MEPRLNRSERTLTTGSRTSDNSCQCVGHQSNVYLLSPHNMQRPWPYPVSERLAKQLSKKNFRFIRINWKAPMGKFLLLRPISYTVFVGLSVTLSTKSTKFGSRYLVDTSSERGKFCTLVVQALLYISAGLVNFGRRGTPWAPKYIFATLFSYIVWPRAMKLGTMKCIGA